MLQPRIPKTLLTSHNSLLEHLTTSLFSLTLTRHKPSTRTFTTSTPLLASHAAQGRANGPTDSAGRRLGLKKGASEYVIPGNIIFKQRGTKWFPGENVGIGKDHTLYALQPGWVRYYRDPDRHPKRRYIGVALVKEGKESILPVPRNAPSRRRLGMFATVRKVDEEALLEEHATEGSIPTAEAPKLVHGKNMMSAKELSQWEPMHELVARAEANQVEVRKFDRKDRWYAWRMRVKKFESKKMMRAAAGVKRKIKAKK